MNFTVYLCNRVHSFYYDDEPCILDENYRRKEAYYGVRDALSTLTLGHRVGGDGVLLDADIDDNGNRWGHEWMQPDPEDYDENEVIAGDARPDWEIKEDEREGGEADAVEESSLDDSGVQADIEATLSDDNDGLSTDDDRPVPVYT
jgi:hypothetical protein